MFGEITDTSNQIAEASKEQSTGVHEINTAIQEINLSNQQTSHNANIVEVKSKELVGVVKNIDESMFELKKIAYRSGG